MMDFAVVFKMDELQISNADYRTPRSGTVKINADAEAGWGNKLDFSKLNGIIPMVGHARNVQVFCCHRDE